MPLRPDIFLLLTDQQSTWTVGGYAARSHETAHEEHGTPTLKTPSIDSLAGRGVLLTGFVVSAAWCVPSRGSLLTGRFPSNHGAGIQRAWLAPGTTTIAHRLASAGYATTYLGKYHLSEGRLPEGFLPRGTGGFDNTRSMFGSLHVRCTLRILTV